MEKLTDISNRISDRIKDLNGMTVISVAIFGSSARNEEYTGSDIDL